MTTRREPDLLDAAAERIALESGRAFSQVRLELAFPQPTIDALPLLAAQD